MVTKDDGHMHNLLRHLYHDLYLVGFD